MTKVTINNKTCREVDTVVFPVFEGKLDVPNEEVNETLKRLEEKEQFKGAFGSTFNSTRKKDGHIQDVVFLGLGKEEELTTDKVRKAFGKVIKTLKTLKSEDVFVAVPAVEKFEISELVKGSTEGILLGSYKFDKYSTDEKNDKELTIDLCGNRAGVDLDKYKDVVSESTYLAKATNVARDLVNEPANIMVPSKLAEEAVNLGKSHGFEVEVKSVKEIEELGMESFLSVAKGSDNEPKLIVMRHMGDPENKDKRLALVGKGLTFDTGGYSLKPSASMDTMKSDMGGSAAVIGAMCLISKLNLKKNVIAVVAACENAISGGSYKPGDIIGSMAGKNIEVLNTDAEGRLTLVDAVTYAIRNEKASEVVDIATLTGAALVALGTTATGVVTNNDEFYSDLEKASKLTGEKVWKLPAFEEYKKLIKSDIADLKNVGGRYAGTITAGLFIGEFVEGKPWLHLDIAGTGWIGSAEDYCPKGGTGEGVRVLYELAKLR
ncbi:MAG: leucyl aminopeptidase [Sarcina sp.]